MTKNPISWVTGDIQLPLLHVLTSYVALSNTDIPRVSMWLGYSGTNMTEKHYREGVRAAEGEAWFHVFPEEAGH